MLYYHFFPMFHNSYTQGVLDKRVNYQDNIAITVFTTNLTEFLLYLCCTTTFSSVPQQLYSGSPRKKDELPGQCGKSTIRLHLSIPCCYVMQQYNTVINCKSFTLLGTQSNKSFVGFIEINKLFSVGFCCLLLLPVWDLGWYHSIVKIRRWFALRGVKMM